MVQFRACQHLASPLGETLIMPMSCPLPCILSVRHPQIKACSSLQELHDFCSELAGRALGGGPLPGLLARG